MKAFKFKLETVLTLREKAENEARQHHAAAGRRLEAVIAELNEAEEEQKRLTEQLEGMQRSSFRPAEREIFWNALNYQKEMCARLAVKVENARKDVEQKLQVLLDARQEHEAMMKIQEKDLQEYNREAERQERAMIDDIVTARHSSTQRQGRGKGET
jgi:flagellar export protein FliJ